jgi:hypothetical protein
MGVEALAWVLLLRSHVLSSRSGVMLRAGSESAATLAGTEMVAT